MARGIYSFLTLILFCDGFLLVTAESAECSSPGGKKQGFSLTFKSKRIEEGEWVTTFVGEKTLENKTDSLNLELKHEIRECDGNQIFHIQGITTSGSPFDNYNGVLLFHPKCGNNVALSNNGKTIMKLSAEDRYNSVVFTNRMLKLNELFEVTIDRIDRKLGYFMGIGVSILSPDEIVIPGHTANLSPGTWMLFHSHLFINGTLTIKENFYNMDSFKVGDRVGLKRTNIGSLHLYVNGEDLGPVAPNVSSSIYGIFEFYGDIAQVTINNRS